MSPNAPQPAGPCGAGLCGGKGKKALKDGVWDENPIAVQIIGICSSLAVTNRFENALVMGAALVFTTTFSNLFVSLLRRATPRRIRMIVELAIIATFVILFDQFLRAFYWDMSKQLGPYVGLIITNCILMGRAEAFALQNPPVVSMVDGMANGMGYSLVLGVIGLFREFVGTGKVLLLEKLGVPVNIASWYAPNQLAVLAPGAFFALGFLVALYNVLKKAKPEAKKP